jgi:hypothetical protein
MSVLHPSSIRLFLIFRPRHHVFPNVSFSKHKATLLPNDGVLPTAGSFTECFEENLLPNGVSLPNFGPQISLLPVPNFGVKICPFN